MSGGGGGVSETADQVQEAQNNVQLFNYQQQYYQPYIQKFVAQQTGDAASPAQANNVKGQVNAEIMKGVSKMAANPRELNAANLTKQTDIAAAMQTAGQESATGKVKQRQLGNIQNIVDIGSGQQTNAMNTQDSIAGQSVQSAIRDKESDLQLTGAEENAAGSVAGAAAAGGAYAYMNRGPAALPDNGTSINQGSPLGVSMSDQDMPAFNDSPNRFLPALA